MIQSNNEYDECGRDIGRPDEVFEIRYLTTEEAADLLRIAGERIATILNEQIDAIAFSPTETEDYSLIRTAMEAIEEWNQAHDAFTAAMAREKK